MGVGIVCAGEECLQAAAVCPNAGSVVEGRLLVKVRSEHVGTRIEEETQADLVVQLGCGLKGGDPTTGANCIGRGASRPQEEGNSLDLLGADGSEKEGVGDRQTAERWVAVEQELCEGGDGDASGEW